MGQARGTMYYVVRGILVLGPLGWHVGAIQIGMGELKHEAERMAVGEKEIREKRPNTRQMVLTGRKFGRGGEETKNKQRKKQRGAQGI